jgi:glycosyltransferase involved in cell wall biosynthesis
MADIPQPSGHQAETANPLVSVLIVSYNCAPALRKCIQALEISPDRVDFEILVVDHGSRDGSQIIDTEFPEVQMLRLPHFCGQTKARNIGLRTARGEFVLLLSPGVILDAGAVTALAKRLEADPGALAVCPEVVDKDGKMVTRMMALPDAAAAARAWDDTSRLAPGSELHDGRAILLRRRTIQGINYLDQRYGEHWGDIELAFQIRRAGKQIIAAPGVRGVLNSQDPLWAPGPEHRAAFAADAANGAAAYIGKHFGFGAGLGFRVKVVLGALVKLLTFQDPGFQLGLLSRVISGYKIDGSSQEL